MKSLQRLDSRIESAEQLVNTIDQMLTELRRTLVVEGRITERQRIALDVAVQERNLSEAESRLTDLRAQRLAEVATLAETHLDPDGAVPGSRDSTVGHDAPRQTRRTIRIFLASSSELRDDRDAFDLYFRQRNDFLLEGGTYLQIVRWENFLDAMSATRLNLQSGSGPPAEGAPRGHQGAHCLAHSFESRTCV